MPAPEYKFTKDWFHWAPEVWEQLVPQLPSRRSFLEIGSYEGRSTVWTVENMLEDGGAITCIDTWEGGEEHVLAGEDMPQAEATFGSNVSLARSKFPEREVRKAKGTSYEALESNPAVAEALDPNWNLPAVLGAGQNWELPAGAFGESAGPV